MIVITIPGDLNENNATVRTTSQNTVEDAVRKNDLNDTVDKKLGTFKGNSTHSVNISRSLGILVTQSGGPGTDPT